ncbi:ESX secretion-associated protein EspG [Amycolatopsis acidiphila]|uniref:ESX secretion-associated protein EspG n=1 Tax=Amycolatopsis acidiphila TaxID=715473 RepID=A0A557ZXM7_9PSEU|nr:ESX secretion-associated protein EspG [Amycolatopsis acidiphila]TVT16744.1 ESX secretion-associated protein EspG [Amycolatopsis acidiphila]UIJ59462.1 ESX secretion-associated protein EspG [Amycolatopsis acidiphila]
MSDETPTPTVFELVDEIVRPLAWAVPRRLSVLTYYDPDGNPELPMGPPAAGIVEEAERQTRWHAALGSLGLSRDGVLTPKAVALFRSLRRGQVRGAVTGVLADSLEPLRLHFFADHETGSVVEYVGGRVQLGSGGARRLADRVVERLPEARPGPGELLRIAADPLGRVAPEHAGQVAQLRELAARPRLATMMFDLTISDKIIAEHPRGAVVLFDTDLGRYLVITAIDEDGNWVLFHSPATGQHVGHWIRQSVQAHLEPACG